MSGKVSPLGRWIWVAAAAALTFCIFGGGWVWGQTNSPAAVATVPPPAVVDQPAAASVAPKADSGNTSWVLMCSALVFIMTAPGLALFYGGLVRRKNVLSVLMQCMMILMLVSIQWVAFGYSLAFGPDHGGLIGGLQYAFMHGVSFAIPNADYAPTVPHMAFAIFQMMFAVITPALIVGAFAERMRFGPFCLFSLLWATLVYDPVAHWIWGQGGIFSQIPSGKGALDFAGGIVVHINAGIAALACAIFLGKRKGYPAKMSPPHNLPFAVIGAGLLWFGWFGFNAGSALQANGLAVNTFLVTHLAGAVAGLTWALLDWIVNKRPTVLGVITGTVAGLATITPASGFVSLGGSAIIGVLAGAIPWLFVMLLKPRLGYDDSLDAFGVHGIGGFIGSLAVGLLADPAINEKAGLFYGDGGQFVIQLKAIGLTTIYAFIVTFMLLKLVDAFFRLRASEHEELVGLDLTQHREAAYTFID